MKNSHTPGPWEAVKCTTHDGYTIRQRRTATRAANVANIAQVGPFPADAKLLALAPELLAELKELAFDCGTLFAGMSPEEIKEQPIWVRAEKSIDRADKLIARAAIAKAEGTA